MPVAGGGFEQAYNAQAAVATGSLLVVANDVVQDTNDKKQIEPMLARLEQRAEKLGKAQALIADNGYFSQDNVSACDKAKIEPLISMGRERLASPPRAPENPSPLEAMAHRLATPEGKRRYALRKQTPEPASSNR